MTSYLTKQ